MTRGAAVASRLGNSVKTALSFVDSPAREVQLSSRHRFHQAAGSYCHGDSELLVRSGVAKVDLVKANCDLSNHTEAQAAGAWIALAAI